jgi:hypothetical protein
MHMNDLLRVGLPALLALLGTAFGLWLGHWRWSSELRMTRRRAFDARRYAAYQDLWNILEDAHVAIRTGRPEPGEVYKLVQHINGFRLRNAIYIEPADSTLSNDYFDSIVQLSRALAYSGSGELEQDWGATREFGKSEIQGIEDLVKANEKVGMLRDQLMGRIRAVMLETSYAPTAP